MLVNCSDYRLTTKVGDILYEHSLLVIFFVF